nr:plasminogen-like [Lytechinus pictus]
MDSIFRLFALTTTFYFVSSNPACTDDPDGMNYRGDLSVTLSGKTCLSWASLELFESITEVFPDAGLGDHNHCRNPDTTFTAWCFTADEWEWEYCAIGDFSPQCTAKYYEEITGKDYRGTMSTTRSGYECLNWTSEMPFTGIRPENYPDAGLGDHNYCRNPDSSAFVWCYIAETESNWEYCNIGLPRPH